MVWVFNESAAELGPRLVLLVLAEHAHDDGTNAFPSVETMMRRTRLSRRSVQGALRKLEAEGQIEMTGTRDSGTNVYRLLMEGGAISARGGADNDAEGAQISTRGGADSAPDPSRTKDLEPSSLGRLPKTVGGKRVSVVEADLAVAVLAAWNAQTGQRNTSREWLEKILRRIREHPDLDLDAHAALIADALAHPWWKDAPSPSVVYGNGAIFEKAIASATAPRSTAGDRRLSTPTGAPTASALVEEAARLRDEGR